MLKKTLAVILSVTLLLSVLTLSVGARGPLDADAVCSLALSYNYDGQSFPGLNIRVFYVAQAFGYGNFILTGAFRDYPVQVNQVKSQDEWKQIASTLSAYVVSDAIQPDYEAVTNETGGVSLEGLVPGLYLVEGVRADYANGYCDFGSFVISVPSLDDQEAWVYDVQANPKSVYVELPPTDITFVVNKLWKDAGHEAKRPQSITLDLYKDGVLAENVVLSSQNDWSYSWTAPADGAVWQAVETNVSEGYTVTLEQEGNAFYVINTHDDPPPPPDTGDTMDIELFVVLMVVSGLVLLIIGVGAWRKGKQK